MKYFVIDPRDNRFDGDKMFAFCKSFDTLKKAVAYCLKEDAVGLKIVKEIDWKIEELI